MKSLCDETIEGFLFSFTVGLPFSRSPSFLSKTNTAGQLVLAGVVLGRSGLGWEIENFEMILIYGVAATTIASGGTYLVKWAKTTGRAEDLG